MPWRRGAILAVAGPDQATHCTGNRSGAGGSAPHFQRCVDLGCGTGLMGDLVRPLVAPGGLEGVDLSAGMVAKASQRGCYDQLAGPQQRRQPYDLLLAADVFVYIGDLAPVLQAAASSAAPRALLAMSTETEPPPGSHSLEVATSARGPEDAA
ncbi:TPR_REGION domain-containing protein, partial [Haematococcus lacustris]